MKQLLLRDADGEDREILAKVQKYRVYITNYTDEEEDKILGRVQSIKYKV